jgi:hypothetical protein
MSPRYKEWLMRIGRGRALAGLLILSGCASVGARTSGETITVSRRPWFAICTGVCPDFDVTVEADGRVRSVRHYFDATDEMASFRSSTAGFARFRSLLAPYRPGEGHPEPSECRHDVDGSEAGFIVKTLEMEIKWSGPAGSAHLIACDTPDNEALKGAIGDALRSVGLEIDGRPAG